MSQSSVHDFIIKRANEDPAQKVRDCYTNSERSLSKFRDWCREIYINWQGIITDKRYGRANFHIHKLLQQVEMETARFLTYYLRSEPYTTVLPTRGDTVDAAKRHEQVLQHFYEHCPTFFIEKMRLMKYTSMYGCGYSMPTWRTITQKVKKQRQVSEYGGAFTDTVEEVVEEVIYDGLWFRTYSPTDVYPDPLATSLQTARYVIVEEWMHIDELIERGKAGVFDINKVYEIPLNSSGQEAMEFRKRRAQLGQYVPSADPEMIRLQHYFSRDRFITLANDKTVIRNVANFYWHKQIPLVMGVKTLDPDGYFPIGTGRALLPSQKMIRLVMNTIIDHVLSHVYPVWKHTGDVDPNSLVWLPNQKIQVKTQADVDLLLPPEMKQDLLMLKQTLEANFEEVAGYFGPQKGFSDKQNTATSDAIFQSEGNIRIQYDIETFERLTLVPEARLCSKLVQQFMPDEMELRLLGPGGMNFQSINKADIQGEFDFKASGSSESVNRAVVQQQMIEFYSVASGATQFVKMPDGAVVPVPVLDAYNMLKDIYEGWGRKNSDKILYRPEVFGIPLSNELLGKYGLPAIPQLDQLQVNPRTGALANDSHMQSLAPEAKQKSPRPRDIIQRANQVNMQAVV